MRTSRWAAVTYGGAMAAWVVATIAMGRVEGGCGAVLAWGDILRVLTTDRVRFGIWGMIPFWIMFAWIQEISDSTPRMPWRLALIGVVSWLTLMASAWGADRVRSRFSERSDCAVGSVSREQ